MATIKVSECAVRDVQGIYKRCEIYDIPTFVISSELNVSFKTYKPKFLYRRESKSTKCVYGIFLYPLPELRWVIARIDRVPPTILYWNHYEVIDSQKKLDDNKNPDGDANSQIDFPKPEINENDNHANPNEINTKKNNYQECLSNEQVEQEEEEKKEDNCLLNFQLQQFFLPPLKKWNKLAGACPLPVLSIIPPEKGQSQKGIGQHKDDEKVYGGPKNDDKNDIQDVKCRAMNMVGHGQILRVTTKLDVLKREWEASELGNHDELEMYLGCVGKVVDMEDDDETVKMQWANRDTCWIPAKACWLTWNKTETVPRYSDEDDPLFEADSTLLAQPVQRWTVEDEENNEEINATIMASLQDR